MLEVKTLKGKFLLVMLIVISVCLMASYFTVAEAYLHSMATGLYEKAYEMQATPMKRVFDVVKMRETWDKVVRTYGKFRGIKGYEIENLRDYTVVIIDAVFEHSELLVTVTIDRDLKVAGLYFRAGTLTYSPPKYVDMEKFEEREICFGTDYRICGYLTLPKDLKEYPAVVLVHGSGPHDRDETIGPNRVFKDIAWGLSSHGIAVLRYDKRTYTYGEKLPPENITVREEVIEDAVEAVKVLKDFAGVNGVFILGHSLGGMLAPQIARESGARGIIMMAASPRKLHEIMIDQINYLKSIGMSEGMENYIPVLEKLGQGKLAPEERVFGVPASYYYDLNTYDPVNTIIDLDIPVLILQGGKDYQVTEKDYNMWREKLKACKEVEYEFYTNLNHLFMTSTATPSPADIYRAGHVDERVIMDIVEWIKRQSR